MNTLKVADFVKEVATLQHEFRPQWKQLLINLSRLDVSALDRVIATRCAEAVAEGCAPRVSVTRSAVVRELIAAEDAGMFDASEQPFKANREASVHVPVNLCGPDREALMRLQARRLANGVSVPTTGILRQLIRAAAAGIVPSSVYMGYEPALNSD